MSEHESQFCAVARDLMPLQLDGVCSRQSEEFLRRHIAACESCRKAYNALLAAVPAAAPKGDAQAPTRAFRQFFRRRTVKSTLIALGCLLVCAVIGFGVYIGLWGDKSHALSLSRYEVALYQTDCGFIATRTTYAGSDRGYVGGGGMSGSTEGDGRYVLYFYQSSSLIPERAPDARYTQPALFYPYEGKLYQADIHLDREGFYLALFAGVDELRQGTRDNYRVIYQAGDEIPVCDDAAYNEYVAGLLAMRGGNWPGFYPREEYELTVPMEEEKIFGIQEMAGKE